MYVMCVSDIGGLLWYLSKESVFFLEQMGKRYQGFLHYDTLGGVNRRKIGVGWIFYFFRIL